jgi:hypothetical protein
MKKILFTLMLLLLLVSVTHAEPLPLSSYYNGQHNESFDLGSEGILDLQLEFSVYKDEEAQTMQDWIGISDDDGYVYSDYVYGYQVFSETSSTAALTYFALTGVNPSTISDVLNDIGEAESLDNERIQSEGIGPISSGFNESVTEAIWEFEDGALVQDERSWYLFLYSDYDWIAGGIEVQPANDDIPIPGVPEPTTLALLGFGTILSLKRRK